MSDCNVVGLDYSARQINDVVGQVLATRKGLLAWFQMSSLSANSSTRLVALLYVATAES